MFYRIKNDTLYDYSNYKYAQDCLETDIAEQAQLDEDKSLVIVQNGVLALNPDYEVQQIQKRERAFYNDFIQVENFGFLRKKPRGYSSIIEAFNSIFNLVNVIGSLPKDLITIYTKPDFANKDQCTQDWLAQNSFMNSAMSAEEFNNLYSSLLEVYNLQEHII